MPTHNQAMGRRRISQHRQPHTQKTMNSSLGKYSKRFRNGAPTTTTGRGRNYAHGGTTLPPQQVHTPQSTHTSTFWPASVGPPPSLGTDHSASSQHHYQSTASYPSSPNVASYSNKGMNNVQQRHRLPPPQSQIHHKRNYGPPKIPPPPQQQNQYRLPPQQKSSNQFTPRSNGGHFQQQRNTANAPTTHHTNVSTTDRSGGNFAGDNRDAAQQNQSANQQQEEQETFLDGMTEEEFLAICSDETEEKPVHPIPQVPNPGGGQFSQPSAAVPTTTNQYARPTGANVNQPINNQQNVQLPPQQSFNRNIPTHHGQQRQQQQTSHSPYPSAKQQNHLPPQSNPVNRILPPQQKRSAHSPVVPARQNVAKQQYQNVLPPQSNHHVNRATSSLQTPQKQVSTTTRINPPVQKQYHQLPPNVPSRNLNVQKVNTPNPVNRNVPHVGDSSSRVDSRLPAPESQKAKLEQHTPKHTERSSASTPTVHPQKSKSGTSKKRSRSTRNSTSRFEAPVKRRRHALEPHVHRVSANMATNRLRTFQRLNLEHKDGLLSVLRVRNDGKQHSGSETLLLSEIATKLFSTMSSVSVNSGSPLDILPPLLECIKLSHSTHDNNLLCSALKIMLTLHTESIEIQEYVSKEFVSPDMIVNASRTHILYDQKCEQKCFNALDEQSRKPEAVSITSEWGKVINASGGEVKYSSSNAKDNTSITNSRNAPNDDPGRQRLKLLNIDTDGEILDVDTNQIMLVDTNDNCPQDMLTTGDPCCRLFEAILQLFQEKMLRMDSSEKVLRIIIPLIDSIVHHASQQQLKVFVKLFTSGHVNLLLHSQYTSLLTMGIGLLVPLLMKVPCSLDLCHSLQYKTQGTTNQPESIFQTIARITHEVEDKQFHDIRKKANTEDERSENFRKLYVLRTEVLKLYSYIISGFRTGVRKLCSPKEEILKIVPALVCTLQQQLLLLLDEKSYCEHRVSLIQRIIAILISMSSEVVIPAYVGTMEMELDGAYNKLKWIDEQPESKKIFTFDRHILSILDKNQ